jgi:thymidylate synthase (FAD)
MKDDFYVPAPEDIAPQSADNKQGRAERALDPAEAERVQAAFAAGQKAAYADYTELIASGLARELARINLPLSLYTEWYWQIDLHNLFHFLELRLDPHAQKEIRLYARALFDITQKVAPRSCAAFEEHFLKGASFSGTEMAELRRRLREAGGRCGGCPPAEGGSGQAKLGSGGGDFPPDTNKNNKNNNDNHYYNELSGKALERFEEKVYGGRRV